MEKYNNNPATELKEIINDGLYGDKELQEIEDRLDEFERANANSIYELDVNSKVDLRFKVGSWTLNHLLGSEIHIATEIHGQNQNGERLSHKIEPHQNFNITIKE